MPIRETNISRTHLKHAEENLKMVVMGDCVLIHKNTTQVETARVRVDLIQADYLQIPDTGRLFRHTGRLSIDTRYRQTILTYRQTICIQYTCTYRQTIYTYRQTIYRYRQTIYTYRQTIYTTR